MEVIARARTGRKPKLDSNHEL